MSYNSGIRNWTFPGPYGAPPPPSSAATEDRTVVIGVRLAPASEPSKAATNSEGFVVRRCVSLHSRDNNNQQQLLSVGEWLRGTVGAFPEWLLKLARRSPSFCRDHSLLLLDFGRGFKILLLVGTAECPSNWEELLENVPRLGIFLAYRERLHGDHRVLDEAQMFREGVLMGDDAFFPHANHVAASQRDHHHMSGSSDGVSSDVFDIVSSATRFYGVENEQDILVFRVKAFADDWSNEDQHIYLGRFPLKTITTANSNEDETEKTNAEVTKPKRRAPRKRKNKEEKTPSAPSDDHNIEAKPAPQTKKTPPATKANPAADKKTEANSAADKKTEANRDADKKPKARKRKSENAPPDDQPKSKVTATTAAAPSPPKRKRRKKNDAGSSVTVGASHDKEKANNSKAVASATSTSSTKKQTSSNDGGAAAPAASSSTKKKRADNNEKSVASPTAQSSTKKKKKADSDNNAATSSTALSSAKEKKSKNDHAASSVKEKKSKKNDATTSSATPSSTKTKNSKQDDAATSSAAPSSTKEQTFSNDNTSNDKSATVKSNKKKRKKQPKDPNKRSEVDFGTDGNERDNEGSDSRNDDNTKETAGNASASAAKKAGRKEDPHKPKQPRSVYNYFTMDIRPQLKEEHPNAEFGDLSSIISKRYKELTPEERGPYKDKAVADKKRFEHEMSVYNEKHKSKEDSGS